MAPKDLSQLVRRRLWELARSADEASLRASRILSAETISRIARHGGSSFISEGGGAGEQGREHNGTYRGDFHRLPHVASFKRSWTLVRRAANCTLRPPEERHAT